MTGNGAKASSDTPPGDGDGARPSRLSLEVVGFLVERGDQGVDAAGPQHRGELQSPHRQLADRAVTDRTLAQGY